MDQLNVGVSLKNIPNHSRRSIRTQLVRRTEDLISRMRWKLFWIRNPQQNAQKESFGFRTTNPAPYMEELNGFEKDLWKMVKHVKFKPVPNSNFKDNLKEAVNKIKNSDEILVKGDKSRNIYKVPVDVYKQKVFDNISLDYNRCDRSKVDDVNSEGAFIANYFELSDRIDCLSEANAFITIKDHKSSFPSRPEYRLINPSKSNIGAISKRILDRVNFEVRTKTGFNQVQSTNQVLKWFESLESKSNLKFLKFDIVSFYPSITMNLLKKAIDWAKEFTNIDSLEEAIILHCCQSFLFFNGKCYTKEGGELFDITQGSLHSSEVSELVGLYLMNVIKDSGLIPINQVVLFRDDGLGAVRATGRQCEFLKQNLTTLLFEKTGLNITCESNIQKVEYLDVCLNLANSSYSPYRKDNSVPLYIHKESNHSPHIKKGFVKMISDRISDLSSNEEVFNSVAPLYNSALRNSGFNENIKFTKNRQKRRTRKRKIMFYNPPYDETISTPIGKHFLELIDKWFPVESDINRIFNKQNLKISYSNMPSVDRILKAKNQKLLEPDKKLKIEGCNCPERQTCPINKHCQTRSLIYRADLKYEVDRQGPQGVLEINKVYFGNSMNTFKQRYAVHKSSFTHQRYKDSTGLSSFIWKLKDRNLPYSLKFSVETLAPAYTKESKICFLCLAEKTSILFSDHFSSLNKRSELMGKCRHRLKWLLLNW